MIHKRESQEELNRCLDEIKISQAVGSHPNIAEYLDFGIIQSNGNFYPYLVTEYLEGKTLQDILKSKPEGLSLTEATPIVQSVCEGLDHLHKNGIVDRDLKPSNIFMTNKGEIKIIDFGISVFTSDTPKTQTSTLGTFGYAAPEQYNQNAKIDARADLHALGTIVYELLHGPIDWDNQLIKHLNWILEKKNLLFDSDSLPLELKDVITKATDLDPDKRHKNVEEFIGEFNAAIGNPSKTKFDYNTLLDVSVSTEHFPFVYLTESSWIRDKKIDNPKLTRNLGLKEDATYHQAAVRYLMMEAVKNIKWTGNSAIDLPSFQKQFSSLPGFRDMSLQDIAQRYTQGYRVPWIKNYKSLCSRLPYLKEASALIEDKLLNSKFSSWIEVKDSFELVEEKKLNNYIKNMLNRYGSDIHKAQFASRAGLVILLTFS